MAYSTGEERIYTSPKGKKEKVKIIKRAIDYENNFIDEPNYKGNFDYFVQVERSGKIENLFCKHKELS